MGFEGRANDPYALKDPYETSSAGREGATGRVRGRAGRTLLAFGGEGTVSSGSDGVVCESSRKPFGNRQLAAALAVAAALVLAALLCAWNVVRGPNIGAYADEGISIAGLQEEDFTVTPAQLAELKCSQLSVEGQGKGQGGESKAGVVTAYGPTLARFLEAYDCEPSDFARIVVTCSDGYKVTLHGDVLEQTVLLSIAKGKSPLDEAHRPMRLVIPSEESGKWCYGVASIEFQRLAEEAAEEGGDADAVSGAASTGGGSGTGESAAAESSDASMGSSASASSSASSSGELKSFGQF